MLLFPGSHGLHFVGQSGLMLVSLISLLVFLQLGMWSFSSFTGAHSFLSGPHTVHEASSEMFQSGRLRGGEGIRATETTRVAFRYARVGILRPGGLLGGVNDRIASSPRLEASRPSQHSPKGGFGSWVLIQCAGLVSLVM